jgi:CheY-like chemotaxis protein
VTHILIVDDSEPDCQLLKKLLDLNGYRVTVAGNGVEALAAARRDRPDAIVSDVLMPKMDGFALCQTWMQDADLEAIPFIFYSANLTLAEDAHVGKVLGAARYLIKPMQQEGFLRELRIVLQQWDGHSRPRT